MGVVRDDAVATREKSKCDGFSEPEDALASLQKLYYEAGMTDVMSFDDALAATVGTDRALLIGNGFSTEYFDYATLLDESGFAPGSAIRNLFDGLGTTDFEAAIQSLEAAALVATAYGDHARAADFLADSELVREGLVRAVNATHPAHRNDLAFRYEPASQFIGHFRSIFTLNYDLLLYWVNLERADLNDGFGLGERSADGRFYGPFRTDARCSIYNLHGGLHLFETEGETLSKALDFGDGVLATISHQIGVRHRLPLYVAEGTSRQKVRKINSSSYLRHCRETLVANTSPVFVYGHSAAENDEHIYRSLFASASPHIYFGVYQPNDDKVACLDGRLALYQRSTGSETPYSFFDSQSAAVWG